MSRLFRLLLVANLAFAAPACGAEKVALPPFAFVELRGAGDVTFVPGAQQEVTILEGDTKVSALRITEGNKLVIDACVRRCPESYHLRVQIQAPHLLPVAVTGRGTITAAPGFSPQKELFAAVAEGGKIDARAVQSANVFAAAQDGELLVNASANLFGVASKGGIVRYSGDPRLMTKIEPGGAVAPLQR